MLVATSIAIMSIETCIYGSTRNPIIVIFAKRIALSFGKSIVNQIDFVSVFVFAYNYVGWFYVSMY